MRKFIFCILSVMLFGQVSFAQAKSAKLDSLMNTFLDANSFNGCILVAESGKVLLHKAYGYKNIESATILDTNTVFDIASLTKPITALGILILYERGLLDLQDDLRKYFPKLNYVGIKIHHMLNHTAGLVDFANEFEKIAHHINDSKVMDNKELISVLEKEHVPLNFRPGAQHAYSNTGYNLLAEIIAKVSGTPYEHFIQVEIFDPIGMKNSFIDISNLDKELLAKGYRNSNGIYFADSLINYIPQLKGTQFEFKTLGSSGIYSTTGDLFRFDQALRKGTLLSPETIELAYTKPKTNSGSEISYGFGWRIFDDDKMKSVYHGGSAPGYRVLFRRGIKNDMNTIILLGNTTNTQSFKVLNGINAILDN